ncbi:hypothetical protein [Pantanalinema sp. GBBB05]|uniref:hypothetical protein n=1 Tax=Pantanalinema sp. GBBB05 TaxID=2604139 RepID=UPI001D1EF239|nr:hypothetical protein [Pantanalinema sp. GBBB05]
MEPLLLSEDCVFFFKFWLDGQIQEGMRWGYKLFRHCRTFDKDHRQQVYTLAWALMEHEVPVVITASQFNYRVWISLNEQLTSWIEATDSATIEFNRSNTMPPSEVLPQSISF